MYHNFHAYLFMNIYSYIIITFIMLSYENYKFMSNYTNLIIIFIYVRLWRVSYSYLIIIFIYVKLWAFKYVNIFPNVHLLKLISYQCSPMDINHNEILFDVKFLIFCMTHVISIFLLLVIDYLFLFCWDWLKLNVII